MAWMADLYIAQKDAHPVNSVTDLLTEAAPDLHGNARVVEREIGDINQRVWGIRDVQSPSPGQYFMIQVDGARTDGATRFRITSDVLSNQQLSRIVRTAQIRYDHREGGGTYEYGLLAGIRSARVAIPNEVGYVAKTSSQALLRAAYGAARTPDRSIAKMYNGALGWLKMMRDKDGSRKEAKARMKANLKRRRRVINRMIQKGRLNP